MSTPRFKLPRGYLSFTQLILWGLKPGKSRESYRKTYYGGKRFNPSLEMAFGNTVTLAMENHEEWVNFIPHYPTFEHEPLQKDGSLFEIEGVPIKAYIDSVNLDVVQFAEQKTGRTPWTQAKVDKHIQHDLYSLLLEEEFGHVEDESYHIWVPTEKVKKSYEMNGIIMEGESTELRLVGPSEDFLGYHMFKRIVTQQQRDAMRGMIVRIAREIEEDYAAMGHLYV